MDARNVNVQAGESQREIKSSADPNEATTGLREPATAGSGVREEGGAPLSNVGRQGKDGLDGLPKDATSN